MDGQTGGSLLFEEVASSRGLGSAGIIGPHRLTAVC